MKKKLKKTGKYFLDGLWIVMILLFIAQLIIAILDIESFNTYKFIKTYFISLLFGLFAFLFAFQAGFLSYKIDQIRSKLGYKEKLKRSKSFLFFILKSLLFLPIPIMIIYPNNNNALSLGRKIIDNDLIIISVIPFSIIFLFTSIFEKFLIPFFLKRRKDL